MYYIVYGLLWLVSLLPMGVLYVLSDCIYGLVFYILKYRRDVALANLKIAFPEKTDKERRQIAKRFYHNLVDTFMETVKEVSASQKFMEKRVACNWEEMNKFHASGKSVQVHLGHNFNWEWGSRVLAKHTLYQVIVVYMPVANKVIDKLFYTLRTRSGCVFLPATKMKDSFVPYRNTQYLMGLVADQNPGDPSGAWWFEFFGRPTPFVKGPARAALLNKTEVVFAFIHKPRRGKYEAVVSDPKFDMATITEQELTRAFVHYLEGVVRQYPEMWLWSHRRWKWEWKEEYGPVLK